MQAARFAPRAARSTRALGRPQALRAARRNVRSYATETPAPPANHTTAGVIGGVAGGLLVFLAGYGWYHMSGAKSFVNAAHSTKSYFDKAFQKTKEAAPEPNQALQWLRDTTLSYAALIPGAKSYVNTAFDDLDKIHDKHGSEVDSIVKDAYNELKDASKDGASMQTVASAWEVLQKAMQRIGALAGDAADDILQNHPELKEKVGGSLTDLKNMGKQYGPEAQKKVDETWSQVQDIIKGGVGVGAVDKIRKLVQERSEDLKSFGDQAWKKGMEQAQPFLDKQPELKKMVEENKDKLLKGDLGKLWKQVQEAANSGNTDDLQKFVKDQVSQAGGKAGGGLDSLLGMIPGGGEIMPKLQQLQELSQKHGKDAEKLMKEAMEDIQKVLQEKTEEGKKIAEQATKEAKK